MLPAARKRNTRLALSALALGSASALSPATVWAGGGVSRRAAAPASQVPVSDSCFDQHELGQEFRQAGQLLSSRQAFLSCQAPRCPTVVRQDCSSWAAEVDKQLPKVAFHVTLDKNDNLLWTNEYKDSKVVYDTDPDTNFFYRFIVSVIGMLPIEDQL